MESPGQDRGDPPRSRPLTQPGTASAAARRTGLWCFIAACRRTSSWSAAGWPGWSRRRSSRTRASRSSLRRAGAGAEPGRAGVLVARRAVHGRQPRAAADGHQGLVRAGAAGLDGQRAVRPRGGPLAAAVGRGVRPLRAPGEARLAARDGPPHLPGRRLGRARGRHGERPRQLGAALPPHLGHRARGRRAFERRVRASAAASRCCSATRSTSCSSRTARSSACAAPCSSRATILRGPSPSRDADRRLRAPRPGRRRHQRRASAATTTWYGGSWPARLGTAAEADGRRRARPRRRPDDPDHRGRRRRRSSTRTACGTTSRACRTGTRSGPTTASASCPARRRCGSTRRGNRLPAPLLPGLRHPRHARRTSWRTGYDYSWFVLTQKVIEKEFALSGSEQNPDITGKDVQATLPAGPRRARPAPVQAFIDKGADFVVARRRCAELVQQMNGLTGEPLIDLAALEKHVVERDRQIDNPFSKDAQVTAIRGAPPLPRRQARPGRHAAPLPRPRRRPAHRGAPQHPDPQDARRAAHRPLRAASCAPTAQPVPGCTPRARSPASAAAACTATTRSRAPSSAAACSPAAPPAARSPPRCSHSSRPPVHTPPVRRPARRASTPTLAGPPGDPSGRAAVEAPVNEPTHLPRRAPRGRPRAPLHARTGWPSATCGWPRPRVARWGTSGRTRRRSGSTSPAGASWPSTSRQSLKKGDRVIVQGKLLQQSYQRDDGRPGSTSSSTLR